MDTWVVVLDGVLEFSPLFPIAFFLAYEGHRASEEKYMLQGASDEEAVTLPQEIEKKRWNRIKGFVAFEVVFTLLVLIARIALRS